MYRSRTASGSRGFSIIELLVVIAIISLMALAASPWFFKIMQRNIMKSAASEMSITFAAARMRAVKRNVPSEARIIIATTGQPFHLIETWEMLATPLKVGEARLTSKVVFPTTGLPTGYENPGPPPVVRFLPDGRTAAPLWFTIRGPAGAGVQNNLTVSVMQTGKINVLGPNITVAKPLGTEWH